MYDRYANLAYDFIKKAAFYKAIKEGESFESIKAGVIAYAKYIKNTGQEEQYVKHGSTFFNQRAWNDDWTLRPGRDTGNPPYKEREYTDEDYFKHYDFSEILE